MKKIISLLSAVAMLALAAVPASAALQYEADGDGWYVIAEMPTDDEVAAYAPTITATATKITTADELTAIDNAIKALEIEGFTSASKKKYGTRLTNSEIDVYKITYNVSNIGTLVNGYDDEYSSSYFGLYDITLGYDPANIPAGFETYPLSYTLPGNVVNKVGVGISSQNGLLNVQYTSAGVSSTQTYPKAAGEEGTVISDTTFTCDYLLVIPKTDATITIPYASSKITYQRNAQNPATTNITGNDIVLGAKEPDPIDPPAPVGDITISAPMALTATDGSIGTAWDVTISNFDAEGKYVATFTDLATSKTRDEGQVIKFEVEAENGTIAFATILNLSEARNVKLEIEKK